MLDERDRIDELQLGGFERRGDKVPLSLWKSRLMALGYTGFGELEPGDLEAAANVLRWIERLIQMGGYEPSDRSNLSRLEKLWWRRSKGLDARFNLIGNRRGRVPKAVEEQIQAEQSRLDAKHKADTLYVRRRMPLAKHWF